jgi:hypothetical protein
MLSPSKFACVALAVASFVPAGFAHAGNATLAYNYLYMAQIATGSLNYQAFAAWDDGTINDEALELAFEANVSMRAAFFEAFDIKQGGADASWNTVRDHLEQAIIKLTFLRNENITSGMMLKVKSALRNADLAYRNMNGLGASFGK